MSLHASPQLTRYRLLVEAGNCGQCGQPRGPHGTKTKCPDCARYHTEYYHMRKDAGICVTSGCIHMARPGRTRCEKCHHTGVRCYTAWRQRHRVQHNALCKAAKQRRAARGICVTCTRPAKPGRKSCEPCLAKARAYSLQRKAKGQEKLPSAPCPPPCASPI